VTVGVEVGRGVADGRGVEVAVDKGVTVGKGVAVEVGVAVGVSVGGTVGLGVGSLEKAAQPAGARRSIHAIAVQRRRGMNSTTVNGALERFMARLLLVRLCRRRPQHATRRTRDATALYRHQPI
jgi:hypothetical protein